MWRYLLALCFAAALNAPPAKAQLSDTPSRTLNIGFNEMRIGGGLVGCELDFDQLVREAGDRHGQAVFIEGSLTFAAPKKGQIVLIFKIVPFDVSQRNGGPVVKKLFDPAFAYATFGTVSTAGKEANKFRCESGGFCAFITDASVIMASMEATRGFQVSYQRVAGEPDMPSDIVMPAPNEKQYSNLLAFGECRKAVIQRARGN